MAYPLILKFMLFTNESFIKYSKNQGALLNDVNIRITLQPSFIFD